jgi:hypothetical protein
MAGQSRHPPPTTGVRCVGRFCVKHGMTGCGARAFRRPILRFTLYTLRFTFFYSNYYSYLCSIKYLIAMSFVQNFCITIAPNPCTIKGKAVSLYRTPHTAHRTPHTAHRTPHISAPYTPFIYIVPHIPAFRRIVVICCRKFRRTRKVVGFALGSSGGRKKSSDLLPEVPADEKSRRICSRKFRRTKKVVGFALGSSGGREKSSDLLSEVPADEKSRRICCRKFRRTKKVVGFVGGVLIF